MIKEWYRSIIGDAEGRHYDYRMVQELPPILKDYRMVQE